MSRVTPVKAFIILLISLVKCHWIFQTQPAIYAGFFKFNFPFMTKINKRTPNKFKYTKNISNEIILSL